MAATIAFMMGIWTTRFPIVCFALACGILHGPGDIIPADIEAARVSYNFHLIDAGIGAYYAYNLNLPDSLDVLVQEGWLPSNMVDPYTGDPIQGNSNAERESGYSLTRDGEGGLVLTWYTDEGPIAQEYGPELLSVTTLGASWEQARKTVLVAWAYASLRAYEAVSGGLPRSISDLESEGFWPYEGVTNLYTGEAMRFDSDQIGDMKWTFENDRVSVRLWLEPSPGAFLKGAGFVYPGTSAY